jgi:hypothetical protein
MRVTSFANERAGSGAAVPDAGYVEEDTCCRRECTFSSRAAALVGMATSSATQSGAKLRDAEEEEDEEDAQEKEQERGLLQTSCFFFLHLLFSLLLEHATKKYSLSPVHCRHLFSQKLESTFCREHILSIENTFYREHNSMATVYQSPPPPSKTKKQKTLITVPNGKGTDRHRRAQTDTDRHRLTQTQTDTNRHEHSHRRTQTQTQTQTQTHTVMMRTQGVHTVAIECVMYTKTHAVMMRTQPPGEPLRRWVQVD